MSTRSMPHVDKERGCAGVDRDISDATKTEAAQACRQGYPAAIVRRRLGRKGGREGPVAAVLVALR